MILSQNKEDYLKALFHLSRDNKQGTAKTKQLAAFLGVSAASVNNMLKKLKEAGFVDYEKYGSVQLTEEGRLVAIRLIRKHRLWETFLCDKLGFKWDEVHEVAEQLEHINSEKLINELDAFLGYPTTDPHGDTIPAADGTFVPREKQPLSSVAEGAVCRLIAVDDSSSDLLQHVSKLGLSLNQSFTVLERQDFDDSVLLEINGKKVWVSSKFAQSVYVV